MEEENDDIAIIRPFWECAIHNAIRLKRVRSSDLKFTKISTAKMCNRMCAHHPVNTSFCQHIQTDITHRQMNVYVCVRDLLNQTLVALLFLVEHVLPSLWQIRYHCIHMFTYTHTHSMAWSVSYTLAYICMYSSLPLITCASTQEIDHDISFSCIASTPTSHIQRVLNTRMRIEGTM